MTTFVDSPRQGSLPLSWRDPDSAPVTAPPTVSNGARPVASLRHSECAGDPAVKILATDALTGLASLQDDSVHAIITSPPYWGLRNYGVEPIVWAPVEYAPMPGVPAIRVPEWAPRENNLCAAREHEWGTWCEHHDTREANQRFTGKHHPHQHGQFCRRCGAWRGALGLEPTPALYIGHLLQVFRALRRVLRKDGSLWLNLGDRYAERAQEGLRRKDLVGIPWRAAYALQADGWYLRSDVVWAKGVSFSSAGAGSAMPESVTDRPVRGHEFVFLLAKSERYYYDHYAVQEDAITQPQRRLTPRSSARNRAMRQDKVYPYRLTDTPGRQQSRRNLRDVWRINTRPFKDAHFAVFPPDLVRPMIRAATPEAGVCPTCGAPYRRRVERARLAVVEPGARDPRTGGLLLKQGWDRTGMGHQAVSEWLAANPLESVGWEPGCACDAGAPVPATVLDPFAGSGTTGVVAIKEGRATILIEPKPGYREIIRRRLGSAHGPGR